MPCPIGAIQPEVSPRHMIYPSSLIVDSDFTFRQCGFQQQHYHDNAATLGICFLLLVICASLCTAILISYGSFVRTSIVCSLPIPFRVLSRMTSHAPRPPDPLCTLLILNLVALFPFLWTIRMFVGPAPGLSHQQYHRYHQSRYKTSGAHP